MFRVRCPRCGQLMFPVQQGYYCLACKLESLKPARDLLPETAGREAKLTAEDHKFLEHIRVRWD